MSRAAAAIAVGVALCATTGCSTSATLRLRDGTRREVRIVRSTARALYVVPAVGGATARIARADIAAIDHPGDVHGLAGAVVAGVLVVPLVDVLGCDRTSCRGWQLLVGGATLGAVAISAWGWTVWLGSRSRAAGRDAEPATASSLSFGRRW